MAASLKNLRPTDAFAAVLLFELEFILHCRKIGKWSDMSLNKSADLQMTYIRNVIISKYIIYESFRSISYSSRSIDNWYQTK